ncbi:MAG: hypothetical protein IBX36_03570, partial [Dehalococcoidia bacterium]|nr:hypothetical protein [Dehalococcoidia bacterium]
MNEDIEKIEERRKEWEENILPKSLKRFGATENPTKFYTPADLKSHDFLEKVGFPGEYPYTAGNYAFPPSAVTPNMIRLGRLGGG